MSDTLATSLRLLAAPPRLLLCDWSGCISDDRLPVYETNARMFRRRNLEVPSYEDWLKASTASVREALIARGQPADDAVFEEYASSFDEVCREGLLPTMYPEAPVFFARLRAMHVPVVVISAHPTDALIAEVKRYGLNDLIDAVVGSVPNKSEAMLRYARAFEKDEVVALGDTIFDIRSARAAGVVPIGITTGYHTRDRFDEEDAFTVVDSLLECAEVMRV